MPLPDDWSYQLGQAFLTAALTCEGIECGRVFVADGCQPEAPPPGCACQLAVVVTEGWEPMPKCGARRVAEIRLVLDLCSLVPQQKDSILDPAAINTQAQANSAMRWGIMRGLRRAWKLGELSSCGEDLGPMAAGLCGRIRPGLWRCIRSGGGSARWESLWRFEDEA